MAGSTAPSPEYLAQTNHPTLDQHVSITFIIIDTFFLLVFYVSRCYKPKAVGIPMLVCNTLAYVLCLGSAVTGILMTQIGGVGHHVEAVPVATFQTWLKLSKTLEFTYQAGVMFSKLAAMCLYRQVFELSNYRRVINFISVIIIIQGSIFLILAGTICRPFHYFWTQVTDPHGGSCGNVMLFYKSYSIPSLVTDVMILVLPWMIFLKLNMPRSERIGLIFTFLAASLGIITCALRFSVFFTTPLFSDPTWYASGGPMIYALIEPSIYMIASILPTTRHLYRRVHRKFREARQARKPKNAEDGSKNGNSAQSAELDDIEKKSGVSSRDITRHTDIWMANLDSSEEELTLAECYRSQQQWS